MGNDERNLSFEELFNICFEISRMLKLTRSERHLWMTLIFINCAYFNNSINFSVSLHALVKLMRMDKRTILKARDGLVSKRLIRYRSEAGKTAVYMLTMPRIKVLKHGFKQECFNAE